MEYLPTGGSTGCALSEEIFNIWAGEVSLLPLPRLPLPQALVQLVVESRQFPQWLFNGDSNEYKQFQLVSGHDPTELPMWLTGTEHVITAVADGQLSQSVLRALDRILHLHQVHISLLIEGPGFPSNESDLRQAIDDLARHVWFTETGPRQGYLFRSEYALKLPKTDKIKIAKSTVDSVAFFFQPKSGYDIGPLPEAMRLSLNSTSQESPQLYLVHWVFEYKGSATADVRRQVLYGMASGLYQRRALGRLDDFVFGTAHSGSTLITYAARWEQTQKGPSEAGQPPDSSNEGKTAIDLKLEGMASPINPAATAKKRSGSSKSVQSSENTEARTKLAGPSGEGFPIKRFKSGSEETPSLVPDDAGVANKNNGYQIVVYQLGEYTTTNLLSLIQFYLLMRASRRLADGYRTNIFTDPWKVVITRLSFSEVFDWPSPRRPRAKAFSGLQTTYENPTGGGGYQAQLADAESDAASVTYEPEDAAEWKEEWRNERQDAIGGCGPSSLKGFKSAKFGIEKLGLDDRVSVYLGSLNH